MKTPENFSTRTLNLSQFENYRLEQIENEKRIIRNNLKLCLLGGLVVGALAYYFQWFAPGIILIMIDIAIYFVLRYRVKSIYKLEFKNVLLTRMVQSIDETFKYYPKEFIGLANFKESNFIKGASSCRGEDYFTGKIEDREFRGSEITVETGSGKQRHLAYRGMYFITDYAFNEEVSIEIVPDLIEKTFGKLGTYFQSLNFVRSNLIKFENETFEKAFVVYSNREDAARRIISERLMQCLINLNQQFNANIYLTFNKNKLFFGVDNRQDIFKVDIRTSVLENDLMKQYFNQYYQYVDALSQILKVL